MRNNFSTRLFWVVFFAFLATQTSAFVNFIAQVEPQQQAANPGQKFHEFRQSVSREQRAGYLDLDGEAGRETLFWWNYQQAQLALTPTILDRQLPFGYSKLLVIYSEPALLGGFSARSGFVVEHETQFGAVLRRQP